MRWNYNINEWFDEFVEFGAELSAVNEFRIGISSIIRERKFRGRRGRKGGKDRGEEGLKREKGFENIVRGGGRRDVS